MDQKQAVLCKTLESDFHFDWVDWVVDMWSQRSSRVPVVFVMEPSVSFFHRTQNVQGSLSRDAWRNLELGDLIQSVCVPMHLYSLMSAVSHSFISPLHTILCLSSSGATASGLQTNYQSDHCEDD